MRTRNRQAILEIKPLREKRADLADNAAFQSPANNGTAGLPIGTRYPDVSASAELYLFGAEMHLYSKPARSTAMKALDWEP